MDLVLDYFEKVGITHNDIHEDENGSFYFSIDDNGEVTDPGYEVKSNKVYLPDNIQKLL